MKTAIRVTTEHYNIETGEVLDSAVMRDEHLEKPVELDGLGYLHIEQINILQSLQDFKIKHQVVLVNQSGICPKCDKKPHKQGLRKSKFHAALTDHEIHMFRLKCPCGWRAPFTIEGLYGSSIHPDLLEKQSKQVAQNSYSSASDNLNAESVDNRSVNSAESLRKNAKKVALVVGDNKLIKPKRVPKKEAASNLIITVDGGHLKSKNKESRSFEAMIAAVYRPENVAAIDKHHNEVTQKTCVASALQDKQVTIKSLVLNAAITEGLHSKITEITCLTDGANNCWSITNSLKPFCKKLTNILDWFHITKRFTVLRNSIGLEFQERLEKIKWHLWHGDYATGLDRIGSLIKDLSNDKSISLLNDLHDYIDRNRQYLVNYQERKHAGLPFTSTMAESYVNCLINTRQKGKRKMQWSRQGANDILQLRTSIFSKSWDSDWIDAKKRIYKKAA